MATISATNVFLVVLCSFGSLVHSSNVVIKDANWKQMLEGEWMIKFYAPWCPACRQLESTWDDLAKWASNDRVFSIGSVDVTQQPALNGRFMVTSLPTIYHVKDGVFRVYASSRSLVDFKKFLLDEEWRDVSPNNGWVSPTSALMNGVSKLFSLSMNIKAFHETLSEDYGLPGWASFALFGLFIIIIGLLGGILLVLLTDWIWGPPQAPREYSAEQLSQEHKKDDDVGGKDDEEEDKDQEEEEEEIQTTENDKEEEDEDSNVRQRKVASE